MCNGHIGSSNRCVASRANRAGSLNVSVLVGAWAIVVLTGFCIVFDYETTPGAQSEVTSQWPANSQIQRREDRPTLVMFAHPKCPCTRASVSELSRIMARCGKQVEAHVVFNRPAELSTDDNWEMTDLWTSADAIPGVSVHRDMGAIETERFGATTSGHVMLFSASGNLVFEGGITSSRGHCGDNAGESAILDQIQGFKNSTKQTPVFGCPLNSPT